MKISAKQQDNRELYVLHNNSIIPFLWQFMRISLLSIFMLLISFQLLLAINVNGQAIGNTPVTVGLNNQPFTVAIKEIEKQTKFRFYYRKADLEELSKLHLSIANRSVAQTLYELLNNTPFSYRQIDLNILIERKKQELKPERKISGKIYVENSKIPVSYALVELLKGSDSTLIAHSYTDTAGVYQILANSNADLLLRVSGLGYQAYTTKIEQSEESIVVAPIYLKVAVSQLKEVTISSNKPLIQRKADRFVVNVANSSLSINNNVWDVLKQVPLVNADDNGKLGIASKQGTVVYINGRKSNLSGEALFNYLSSLPSTTLSDIEIITAPGSEFDASGNAGILNIIFKKRESDGYQASFSITDKQGKYNSQQVSSAFNYRKGNFGLNATPYFNRNRRLITEQHDTEFRGINTSMLLNLSSLDRNEFRTFYGGNIALEYNLTKKQSLAATLNYGPNTHRLEWINNSAYINKTTQIIDSSFVFTNSSKVKGHTLDVGLNYQLNLDTLGQQIIASGNYFEYINRTQQTTLATVNGTNELRRNEIAVLPQQIKNYTFALDYKLPIGKIFKLKMGVRSFNTSTNNELYYAVANGAGSYIKDELRTTNYTYKERISAVYSSLDISLSKQLGITAGMRLEQSNTNGKELIHQQVAVDKDYLNLFPTISVNYSPNQTHMFSYSLSKRINRPDFWQLNSLRIYSNPTQYVEGNPFLQSSYILTNELSYTLKSRYIFLLSYAHLSDNFSQFLLANNIDNITRIVWLNYGKGNGVDFSFVGNFSIGKFVQSSLTLTGSYNSYKGKAEEEIINNSGFAGNLKMNNTINISKKKGIATFLNFNYFTAAVYDIGEGSRGKPYSNLTIGFRKTAKQFTITLTGSDILKTSANKSTINSRYASTYNNNYWDTRSIQLNIRYNFGNNKLQRNKPKENAAQEIINRAGG